MRDIWSKNSGDYNNSSDGEMPPRKVRLAPPTMMHNLPAELIWRFAEHLPATRDVSNFKASCQPHVKLSTRDATAPIAPNVIKKSPRTPSPVSTYVFALS